MRAEKMRLTRMRAQIEAAATRLQKKLADFDAYKVVNPAHRIVRTHDHHVVF